jgi:Flp pilus assembly protein TadD
MKRVLIALVVVIALAAAVVRVQPAGQARVIRRGDDLRAVHGRAGIVFPGGATCFVRAANGLLTFEESFQLADAGGEVISLPVRFDYALPQRVPAGADGDWCSALSASVKQSLGAWLAAQPIGPLRSDPRTAGVAAAESLASALKQDGMEARLLTVRPRVPATALATLPVPAIASAATKQAPVLFVGLDGGDWQLLDRFIEQGAMPNLASLVRDGASGLLGSEHPPLSPLLWTSMMTGKSPLEHEILDFARFNPATGTKEPITSTERKVPAIWNMATAGGKSVAVFGIWATWPAEPVRGLLVSDRLFGFLFAESERPPGLVYPPQREAWAREILAQAERDTGFEQVRQYFPWLTNEEYDRLRQASEPYAHPVSALRRILVETAVYDRLARETLRDDLPDLTILYLQGTDSIGHVFAPYTAPRQPHISEQDFARYAGVPELYFRHVDKLLGDYAAIVRDKGARLVVASDHGFHWFEGRPAQLSSFAAATAAKWHRSDGILLKWGEGIAASRDRSKRDLRISDVCAMLAEMIGLPRADYAAHYKPAPEAAVARDSGAAKEELAKLKALGYIGSTEQTSRPASAAGSTRTAGWYNNSGLILKDRKRTAEAIAAFEKAIEIDPDLPSALWNLSDLLFARREIDRSDDLLIRSAAHGLPEANKFIIGRAIGYQREGSADRSLELLDGAVRAKPDDPELRMFRGRYRIELRDCDGALADFVAAQGLAPRNPVPHASAGLALTCLGRGNEARAAYARSLAIDPNQPRLRALMGSLSP